MYIRPDESKVTPLKLLGSNGNRDVEGRVEIPLERTVILSCVQEVRVRVRLQELIPRCRSSQVFVS